MQSGRDDEVGVLRRLLQYQTVILQSQRDLLHLDNPREMYQKLVDNIVLQTEALGATIIVQDVQNDLFLIEAARDVDAPPTDGEKNGDGLRSSPVGTICPTVVARNVFQTGQREGPMDPGRSDLTREVEDIRPMYGQVRSVMAFPVKLEKSGKPVAVLVIESGELQHFSPELINTLEELAIALGLALNRHQERQELEKIKNEVEILAFHDALTHLPNRRLLEDSLEGAIERAERYQIPLAVCMLDLDGFKPINDAHGHEAGDQVLLETTSRLKDCLRQSDFLARLGGDEFVLLLEGIRDEDALAAILEKIGIAIRQPIRLANGASVMVQLSAGVCLFPREWSKNPDMLLRLADQALYESKSNKTVRQRFWTMFRQPVPDRKG